MSITREQIRERFGSGHDASWLECADIILDVLELVGLAPWLQSAAPPPPAQAPEPDGKDEGERHEDAETFLGIYKTARDQEDLRYSRAGQIRSLFALAADVRAQEQARQGKEVERLRAELAEANEALARAYMSPQKLTEWQRPRCMDKSLMDDLCERLRGHEGDHCTDPNGIDGTRWNQSEATALRSQPAPAAPLAAAERKRAIHLLQALSQAASSDAVSGLLREEAVRQAAELIVALESSAPAPPVSVERLAAVLEKAHIHWNPNEGPVWECIARRVITLLAPGGRTDAPQSGPLKLDAEAQVFFYEQNFYVLSNFSSFGLNWSDIWFPMSEAAYQWEKFPNRPLIRAQIRDAKSAHEAFKLAEHYKSEVRSNWLDIRLDTMRSILRAKAEQHEYVRRKLLQTGDRKLIENSWRDAFWGWGPNRDGQNMLGRLWMEIRAELQQRPDLASGGEGETP